MPRVTTVKKARKHQGTCGRCATELPPGEPYRHWSFRYGGTRKRCMAPGCAPRGSELTQAKWGDALAAVEDARTMVDGASIGSYDDLETALEVASDEVRTVADEYRDAADAMGDAGYQYEEWADQLDEVADSLDGFSADEDGEWEDAVSEAVAILDDAESDVCVS